MTLARGVAMASIVVVETDVDLCNLVTLKLRMCGHQVGAASDGHSGLRLCLRSRPDVLILDERVPSILCPDSWDRVRTSLGMPCCANCRWWC